MTIWPQLRKRLGGLKVEYEFVVSGDIRDKMKKYLQVIPPAIGIDRCG